LAIIFLRLRTETQKTSPARPLHLHWQRDWQPGLDFTRFNRHEAGNRKLKRVSISKRKYSVEFQGRGAVKQVIEGGYSAREVSERIGVSMKSLY